MLMNACSVVASVVDKMSVAIVQEIYEHLANENVHNTHTELNLHLLDDCCKCYAANIFRD